MDNQEQKELEPVVIAAESETPVDDFQLELQYFDEKEEEERRYQEKTGLNPNTLCGAIETIIFMSDKPIPITKIRNYIDSEMPLRVIHESISRLQNEYENAHHGIRLQEVAEGYQFRTKATFSKYVQDIFKVNALVLTPSAMEVLAIIAYKQPVSKTTIEKIRGVDSSHLVRALMEKRLVKIVGRAEDELGRPSVYATTQEFLEVFNLADLSQLPPEYEIQELSEQKSTAAISEIKEIVGLAKGDFQAEDLQELDSLSEMIKNITVDTDFTKGLKEEEKKRIEGQKLEMGGGAAERPRTAFEIMEEFISRTEIKKQNEKATEQHENELEKIRSELLDIPMTIKLQEADGEAETIEIEEIFEAEAVGEYSDEELSLSEALDQAFQKMQETSEKIEEFLQAEEEEEAISEEEEAEIKALNDEVFQRDADYIDPEIEKIVEDGKEMTLKAKGLDLDISFINFDSLSLEVLEEDQEGTENLSLKQESEGTTQS